jgi:uncharacterized protein
MEFTQDFAQANYLITGYASDHVLINNEPHHHSVIIGPDYLDSPWNVSSVSELNELNLEAIFQQNPEIVILGTGGTLILPQPEIIALFAHNHIGLEPMSTPAACRTYGILLAEGRNVMAGIILSND